KTAQIQAPAPPLVAKPAVRKPAARIIPKKKKLAPPTPDQKVPEFKKRSKPTGWIYWLIPSAFADDLSWDVLLKWNSVEGARGYRLQISREKSFKSTLINTEIKASQYVWFYEPGMENKKGRVFYRLASVDDAGEVGPYSDPITLYIPKELIAAAKEGIKPTVTVAERVVIAAKAVAQAPPAPIAPLVPTQRTSTWGADIHTGFGDLKQKTSDASLATVNAQRPYLQQKFNLNGETIITRGSDQVIWDLALESVLSSFSKPDTTRTTVQPTVKIFTLRADLMRSSQNSGGQFGWNLGYGIRLDRNFRWVKTGPQTVEARSAVSVGPLIGFMRKYSYLTGLRIQETGLLIGAPFTGLFAPGYYGADARIWAEWKLVPLSKDWIGLRPEAEIGYHRWKVPEGTSLLSWNLWIAVSFHSEN
ncbi:MAG: hypothetical protein AABZ55_00110, partial [Bdellovibrionota bacterium]